MSGSTIKIPAELFALAESSRFEGSIELPIVSVGPDDYLFPDPVTWYVDVTNTGSAFLVSGTAEGVGHVACSRCLEEAEYDFKGAIEGYFVCEGAEVEGGDAEDDSDEDEFEVLPADHIIDLEPLIRSALIVDAPNMPLCRDDCKGLCAVCGANLNEAECGCGQRRDLEEFDRLANPFAVLADYEFSE